MGVAVGGLDLEDAVAEFEDRDVEGAAAEVVHGDLLIVFLVEAIRQSRRRGLVDNPLDVEAGNPPGILRGLALGVIEIGWNGDDRLGHLLVQVRLSIRLELLQDHRGDLGRRIRVAIRELDPDPVCLAILFDGVRDELLAALDLNVIPAPAHEALDRVNGVFRVGDGLALGKLPYKPLSSLGECDDGRDGAPTLGGRNDRWLAALHDGHDRVRRTEVDADDLSHVMAPVVLEFSGWGGPNVARGRRTD